MRVSRNAGADAPINLIVVLESNHLLLIDTKIQACTAVCSYFNGKKGFDIFVLIYSDTMEYVTCKVGFRRYSLTILSVYVEP